jgi:HTH-type transcriptional regulator / antitoxin HipB
MAGTEVRHALVLGQAIRAARKTQGITQVAVAEAVGTYPRAIIDLERGRSGDLNLVLDVLAVVGLRLRVEER